MWINERKTCSMSVLSWQRHSGLEHTFAGRVACREWCTRNSGDIGIRDGYHHVHEFIGFRLLIVKDLPFKH